MAYPPDLRWTLFVQELARGFNWWSVCGHSRFGSHIESETLTLAVGTLFGCYLESVQRPIELSSLVLKSQIIDRETNDGVRFAA